MVISNGFGVFFLFFFSKKTHQRKARKLMNLLKSYELVKPSQK